LRRIDLATFSATTICNGGETRGGTWGRDGTILFTPSPGGPIHRVPATGGSPQPVTKLDPGRKETGHWRPSFLPDGKHFLFMTLSEISDEAGVFIGSLDSPDVRRVLPMPTPAVYAEPGYLLYLNDFDLYAQPFDAGKLVTQGDGFLIARGVDYNGQYGSAGFSVAKNGTLVFHRRGPDAMTALIRMPVDGEGETPMGTDGVNLDLSRDGTRIAMQRIPAQQRNSDIWTYDLLRKISTRITFETAEEVGPVWSADGRTLVYSVSGVSGSSVRTRPSGGGGQEQILFSGTTEEAMEIIDWSRDGRYLLAEGYTLTTRMDLLAVEVATKKITPFAKTPFTENSGRFRPDGKWVAYQADDAGRSEIFLQPFPPDGSRSQVSTGGGLAPRWTGDGRRLFYVSGDSHLMSVDVSTEGGVTLGTPTKHRLIGSNDYVLLPDGKEVIISRRDASTAQALEVITHWRP
jgi:Tol biopolymer transport system component